MLTIANAFRDDLKPKFGIPTIAPTPGQAFDKNNDLFLCDDGRTILHRDGHVSYGGPSDAIVDYNKRNMTKAAFAECYGDDTEEDFAMLHGSMPPKTIKETIDNIAAARGVTLYRKG